MPSFSDSIFLFILALLLFGPKKLPVLARELGKWVGEFRKASNEFKMQMEEELRVSEQADRQKQIAAMEAAAPVAPALESATGTEASAAAPETVEAGAIPYGGMDGVRAPATAVVPMPAVAAEPLPIATEGEMKIMPPATGLPQARAPKPGQSALSSLLNAVPQMPPEEVAAQAHGAAVEAPQEESVAHGD
jgi:sec-independent protein translocase protein TatB